MLAAMRRPYSAASFRALVLGVRKRMPEAAIGTDLIVGFPGETERDFDEQVRVISDLALTHVHVFPYSDRPGTEASRLPSKVAGAVIRRRAEHLRAIGRELNQRFVQNQVGHERQALTLEDGSMALTDNYLKVRIAGGRTRNERVRVKLVSVSPLWGEVVA
jgi:threonylcarbamoyladenosine tRNA methylthiotransferase MtaB